MPRCQAIRSASSWRCCKKTLRGWGGVACTSRDPPQEPHDRDEVEGPSHVHDEISRGELAGLQPGPRSPRRCDGVGVLGSDHCLGGPPKRPAGWAAAVLGSRHRDRSDPAIPLPSPAAPGRRVPARPVRDDAPRPLHTTLSRRSQHLRRRLRPPVPPDEGLHLVLDSTGLSLVGAGEWAAAKHGGRGRRGWRKLHRGVEQSGAILVHTLTEATGDDATTALDLLTAVEGPLVRITADAASDTVAVYQTATARGATVVIPPAWTANVSGHGPRSPAPDRTITVVQQLGRRRWKKTSGYHRQSRVENTFFRDTSIIGDGFRARSPAGQGSDVVLGCEILNRMTELGRPVSYRIGR